MEALIVDDEEMVRDVMEKFLAVISRRLGMEMEVFVADGIGSAKHMLDERNFQLIITDLSLSGLDTKSGLDVIRYARSRGQKFSWILMTGCMIKGAEEEAEGLGVTEVLFKPFSLQSVLGAIGKASRV